jgi:hypothetical protein
MLMGRKLATAAQVKAAAAEKRAAKAETAGPRKPAAPRSTAEKAAPAPKVTRKAPVLDPNAGKHEQLGEIAEKVLRLRRDVWRLAAHPDNVQHISARTFRDAMIAAGLDAAHYGLPHKIWRQNVETGHREVHLWMQSRIAASRIKAKIKRHCNGDRTLEKQLYTALKIGNWSATPWLRRQTRKMYGGMVPRPSLRLRFSLDNCSYDVQRDAKGNLWLAVMGISPGKRVRLCLGKLPEAMSPTSEIQLYLEPDGRIEVSMTVDETVACRPNAPKKSRRQRDTTAVGTSAPVQELVVKPETAPRPKRDMAGFDAGRTEVGIDDQGTIYGRGFGAMVGAYDGARTARDGQWNKLRSLADNLLERAKAAREAGDTDTALRLERRRANIIEHNLGSTRRDAAHTKHRARVRDYVFRAIHELACTAHVVVAENLSHEFTTSNRSKKQNRLNSGWMRSILAEALVSVTRRRGSSAVFVNPAYTSQQVHACGHLGVRRHGFVHCNVDDCPRRGEKFDDDMDAALVLVDRASDREITLSMTPKQVRAVLESRYGQSSSGGDLSRLGLSCGETA